MGHISEAWPNLAPPSANFLTDCATESHRACGDCDYGLFPCCYGVSRFCSPDRVSLCANPASELFQNLSNISAAR
jgi:hypothetical protein